MASPNVEGIGHTCILIGVTPKCGIEKGPCNVVGAVGHVIQSDPLRPIIPPLRCYACNVAHCGRAQHQIVHANIIVV